MNWNKGCMYSSGLETTLSYHEIKQIEDSGSLSVDTRTYTKKGINEALNDPLPLSYYVQEMNRNIVKATLAEQRSKECGQREVDPIPNSISSSEAEFFNWKYYFRFRFNSRFWGKTEFTGKRGPWWYFKTKNYGNIQVKRITEGNLYIFTNRSKIKEIIRFLDEESKFFYIEETYDATFGYGIRLDRPVEDLDCPVIVPKFTLDLDEIEELNKMHSLC